MNSLILKRALMSRQLIMGRQMMATRALKPGEEVYRHYESTQITDQRRFEDEPEPGEDDQISKCCKFPRQFYRINF